MFIPTGVVMAYSVSMNDMKIFRGMLTLYEDYQYHERYGSNVGHSYYWGSIALPG